jgi:sulfite exporter TauE/SafE
MPGAKACLILAGATAVLSRLETAGAWLWRHIQPWSRAVLPVTSLPRALGLGALWGWLPCGMVYSVVLIALASGSTLRGAAVMLAFGLGTLPNLLAIGMLLARATTCARGMRIATGAVVAGFGVYGLVSLGLGVLGAVAPGHAHH